MTDTVYELDVAGRPVRALSATEALEAERARHEAAEDRREASVRAARERGAAEAARRATLPAIEWEAVHGEGALDRTIYRARVPGTGWLVASAGGGLAFVPDRGGAWAPAPGAAAPPGEEPS